ncbi:MAG: acyl carrier protein [Pyrinomonadaceae bacterium]|nr:acyl carrier protein [Pyrinomonadaceae bacterium]
MKQQIRDFVQKTLIGDLKAGELSTSENLLGGGLIDSLGVMQLIAFVEDEFDLSIPTKDMVIENFESIDAVCGYIGRRKDTES